MSDKTFYFSWEDEINKYKDATNKQDLVIDSPSKYSRYPQIIIKDNKCEKNKGEIKKDERGEPLKYGDKQDYPEFNDQIQINMGNFPRKLANWKIWKHDALVRALARNNVDKLTCEESLNKGKIDFFWTLKKNDSLTSDEKKLLKKSDFTYLARSEDYLDEILNLIVVVTAEMLNSKICSVMIVDKKACLIDFNISSLAIHNQIYIFTMRKIMILKKDY